MKLSQLLTRKKLRATTARRALGATEMDYEEMSEPNMRKDFAAHVRGAFPLGLLRKRIIAGPISTCEISHPLSPSFVAVKN